MPTSRCMPAAALLALTIACTPRLEPEPSAASARHPEVAGRPELAKLSSGLLEARRRAAAGESDEQIRAALPLVDLSDGRARIEVKLERLTEEIVESLRQAGLEEESHSLEYARAYGWVALDRLDEVAALVEVSTIGTFPAARTRKAPARPADEPPSPPPTL